MQRAMREALLAHNTRGAGGAGSRESQRIERARLMTSALSFKFYIFHTNSHTQRHRVPHADADTAHNIYGCVRVCEGAYRGLLGGAY